MSECFKLLNGLYGMYYRKVKGSKGYVFQSRFNSTLIEQDAYLVKSIKKFDRRTRPIDQSIGNQRKDECYFEPVEKVLWEFENIKGVKVEEIDITTLTGKRQRGELLVLLRERTGFTYKEISRDFDIFGDIKIQFPS
jgi:hypothetical protein